MAFKDNYIVALFASLCPLGNCMIARISIGTRLAALGQHITKRWRYKEHARTVRCSDMIQLI